MTGTIFDVTFAILSIPPNITAATIIDKIIPVTHPSMPKYS